VRALCYWDGRTLRLESRNQLDITRRYPELHTLADALGSRTAVLDGEIVALDEADRPSFPLLQNRMHVNDPVSIRRLVDEGSIEPSRYAQIGLRGYWPGEEEFAWQAERGITSLFAHDVRDLGIREVVRRAVEGPVELIAILGPHGERMHLHDH